MKPEAQRIAIAEACGYTNVDKDRHGYLVAEGKIDHYGIPDYLNDLNAMHEAEKVMSDDQISGPFSSHLAAIAGSIDRILLPCHRATAAQRAEAFLKCLGLWKDDACPQSEISTTANP